MNINLIDRWVKMALTNYLSGGDINILFYYDCWPVITGHLRLYNLLFIRLLIVTLLKESDEIGWNWGILKQIANIVCALCLLECNTTIWLTTSSVRLYSEFSFVFYRLK